MNIFVSSPDPVECALALDNRRLVKMILESTQMLSVTTSMYENAPYRNTHVNHPRTVWVRTNQSNFAWLLAHVRALSSEYTYRYGKIHFCSQYFSDFDDILPALPKGDLTPWANCTPHKDKPIHEAYRLTLIEKWCNDINPQWGVRGMPSWL